MKLVTFSVDTPDNRTNSRLRKGGPCTAVCFTNQFLFDGNQLGHVKTMAWAVYKDRDADSPAYAVAEQAICRPFHAVAYKTRLVVYAWCWPHFATPNTAWNFRDITLDAWFFTSKTASYQDLQTVPGYFKFKLTGRAVEQLGASL